MASVRDIKIAEALLMLCLGYYVMKRVNIAEIEALHDGFSCIKIAMGHAFHEHILPIK